MPVILIRNEIEHVLFLLSRGSLDMALEGQGHLPICIFDFTVRLEEKKDFTWLEGYVI